MIFRSRYCRTLLLLALTLLAVPLFAQQTGSLSGRVNATDGSALPGVTVEAHCAALPQPRVTTTNEVGEYRLPQLPPGPCKLTYSLAGMQSTTRNATVLLSQDVATNVSLGMAGVSESITVTAESTLIDPETTEIKSAVSEETIDDLPVGQEYRDLVKLIPAVQVTQDIVRGPSAGASGQDNVYLFDGVNVTLPLFGTLSAEPSSHDIQQISVIKGGAKAIDFNRAGGFQIDSVSKSGTNEWKGQVEYQVQPASLTSDQKVTTFRSVYDRDRTWGTLSLGGPVVRDRLFVYGSYFRPTISDQGSTNLYGAVPDYKSTRNEGFAKLTYTPLSSVLLNGSYRRSNHTEEAASISSFEAPTASSGNESKLRIGTFEGSWVINNRSFATAKFTDFANETLGLPDVLATGTISTTLGTQLDLNALDTLGHFDVPCPTGIAPGTPCDPSLAPNNAFNTVVNPLINRYGYVGANGHRIGGGAVGTASLFNDEDFYRKSGQIGYDLTLGTAMTHDLHFGYQQSEDTEDLLRSSNGWGLIRAEGGGTVNCPSGTACAGKPYFFSARFQQQSAGDIPPIHSVLQTKNIEVNDTIRFNKWSFNVGVLASQDRLLGQGLREDPSTVSGYVAELGHQYRMYSIGFDKQLQPRLGATWTYNNQDNVFASYARYNPSATSLPRAASWARNYTGTIRAFFDANGVLIGSQTVPSSSGKFFQKNLTPRTVNEYMIGTSQQISSGWSARAYGRYRYTSHFWEDTNNTGRQFLDAPADIPHDLYIPELSAYRAQVGGSSYVIAELDGAFTKYVEGTVESDWRRGRAFVRGSYTWSQYYGNFDQDNTTTANDDNTFIGSSFLADAQGRQIWNNRYGWLRGDRPHLLKLYGTYALPWNASAGAYTFYESGHPWEVWNYEPYLAIGADPDDTSRYAEPAGRRRTPSHYQLDVNYTQNIGVMGRTLQLSADVFNVFDKQTGYNPNPKIHDADFSQFRSYWAPRRIQLAVRFEF
ncbi:MAG TPA: carboxypeptidase regulatory-like domain-containing protein [Thermoanaerobaculia bacterium]